MSEWVDLIWIAHLVSTWYMTGLIWFVQLVHYPLMNRVSPPNYIAFQQAHMNRTVWAVGPMMLLEAVTAAALLFVRPEGFSMILAITGFILVLALWISSAVFQVPCHLKLGKGFDAVPHRRLVRTNWIRTIAWSLRSALLAGVLGGVW